MVKHIVMALYDGVMISFNLSYRQCLIEPLDEKVKLVKRRVVKKEEDSLVVDFTLKRYLHTVSN